jgi:hypothetical protein
MAFCVIGIHIDGIFCLASWLLARLIFDPEVIRSNETSVHIPEDNVYINRCENLKSYKVTKFACNLCLRFSSLDLNQRKNRNCKGTGTL